MVFVTVINVSLIMLPFFQTARDEEPALDNRHLLREVLFKMIIIKVSKKIQRASIIFSCLTPFQQNAKKPRKGCLPWRLLIESFL